MQHVSLIVAMARNGVIGRDGGLPWRLAADLRRFKRLTMGHHILMGRKTFESIGRLLPGRTSVVITRQPNYDAGGALVAGSLEAALAMVRYDAEVFIIGGAGDLSPSLAPGESHVSHQRSRPKRSAMQHFPTGIVAAGMLSSERIISPMSGMNLHTRFQSSNEPQHLTDQLGCLAGNLSFVGTLAGPWFTIGA